MDSIPTAGIGSDGVGIRPAPSDANGEPAWASTPESYKVGLAPNAVAATRRT